MDNRWLSMDFQANGKQHDELTAAYVSESAGRWGLRALGTVLCQLVPAYDPKIRPSMKKCRNLLIKMQTNNHYSTILITASKSSYLFCSRKAGTHWPWIQYEVGRLLSCITIHHRKARSM